MTRNRIIKVVCLTIGAVLFIIAALPLVSGGGRHKRRAVTITSGVYKETQPRPTYAQFDDVDDEEPTAYETKAPEPETTVEETIPEETIYGEAEFTDDTPEASSAITEENYKRVLTNIIGGSDLIYSNSRECFTDNYMEHKDEFNESNPLYKHIDMNSWEYGDYMSGECAIRIQDVGVYRYSYTIVDGRLDSITYEGEE